jgi:endogenous inhibitor of DNA gyrase (YacG/DUF329 family)
MTETFEDLFGLLGLDAAIDDSKVIAQAIERKKREWSNPSSPDHLQNAHNRGRIKWIADELSDPVKRAEYRKRATSESERQREEARQLLNDLLETLDGEGPATTGDIDRLAKLVGPRIGRKQLEEIVTRAVGLESASGSKPPRMATGAISIVTANEIASKLALVGKRDLYDFLDGTRDSTPAILLDRTREEYARAEGKKQTPLHSARLGLLGHAETLFKNADAKKSYDAHLAQLFLKPLDLHIGLLGDRGAITPDGLTALKSRGVRLGATAEAAEAYIRRVIQTRKYRLQDQQAGARGLPARTFCGPCGEPAWSAAEVYCGKCKAKLVRPCPNCGKPVQSMNPFCGACGFNTGDAPWIDEQMALAKTASTAGEFEAAETILRAVLRVWPKYELALAELKTCAEQAAGAAAVDLEFDRLVRERRLQAAEMLLSKVITRFGPRRFAALRPRLEKARRRAADVVEQGREALAERNLALAQARFEAALAIEVDQPEATAELARLPVDAPASIKLLRRGGKIELSWPATLPGTRYQVLRRIGGPLAGDTNDTVLTELAGLSWTDSSPPCGPQLHYGVVAMRRGNLSPVRAAPPTLVPSRVEQFRALAGDGLVNITWKTPPGAPGVELRARRGKGREETWRPRGSAFVHRDLTNGEAVEYVIAAVYPDPTSTGEIRSDEATATATPSTMLEPIAVLDAKRVGAEVYLKWTPPPNGRVEVRLLAEALTHDFGARVSDTDLALLGKSVPILSDRTGETRIDLSANPAEVAGGLARFVIVAAGGSSATIGATACVVMLDPVRKPTSKVSGASILLQWTWPDRGDQVRIAVRFDSEPTGPDDPAAVHYDITRQAYQRDAGFRIPSRTEQPHHIGLWVGQSGVSERSGSVTLVETMGVSREVVYRSVRKAIVGKQRVIQFSGPVGIVLREVEIYSRQDYPPIGRSDGMLIARAERIELAGGRAEMDVPSEALQAGAFVKVFCRDQDSVRLRSQDAGGVRL